MACPLCEFLEGKLGLLFNKMMKHATDDDCTRYDEYFKWYGQLSEELKLACAMNRRGGLRVGTWRRTGRQMAFAVLDDGVLYGYTLLEDGGFDYRTVKPGDRAVEVIESSSATTFGTVGEALLAMDGAVVVRRSSRRPCV